MDREPTPALEPTKRRPTRAIAVGIAVAADAVQFGLAPFFGEGIASPVNDALDLAVAGALIWLLGFHWALVPAAAAELMPGLDLAPTWTASVAFIVAPPKLRWWVAGGALALLLVAAYAIFRIAR
ncbi:MAG TPA: hypothetical protein VH083_27495 [Myxococcales bacterium]|jgi:hypothetical protein|nr:hypothetical protein [Myxococcales bacterium]